MKVMTRLNTTLLIFLLGYSIVATAQETKTDVSNGDGKSCSYLQYEPKEGDLFNRGEMRPITTVWFEVFDCMDDTQDNRMRIVDAVARAYGHQGTDFVNSEPKVSRQNGHGDCFESTEDPSVAVSIYYLFDNESIQGFVHTQPKDGICVASSGGRGGPGGGMFGGRGRPADG